MMGGVGRVDAPARAVAVERRTRSDRHDHVDLALWMAMVRPLDVGHVHHVDAEAGKCRGGLGDAAELDAAGRAIAHPAVLDRLVAGGLDRLEGGPCRRELGVELGRKRCVERLAGERAGDF